MDIQTPAIGNNWLVGVFALLHIALVSMGGLAPMVVFLAEGSALKRRDQEFRRVVKEFFTLALEIAVIGGILGSGLVVVLIGLYPQALTLVINVFFWFVVLQLFCFIAGLAFQFAYYFSWNHPQGRHRLWGLIGAVLPLVPFVVFSAAASFLNNPGSWPESGNIWGAVFNPVTIPSALHRMATGIALIGAFLMVLFRIKGRGETGAKRAIHDRGILWGARLVITALEVQIVLGVIRTLVVRPEGKDMIMGGSLTFNWILGIVFGLLAWAVLFFATRRGKSVPSKGLLALIVVLVLGATWSMGITRAQERGHFAIVGVMDKQGSTVKLPAAYQVSDTVSGEDVFKRSCGACHPGLAGDASSLAKSNFSDAQSLMAFLRDPKSKNIAMPPFDGTDTELQAVAAYLLGQPADQVPAVASEATAATAPDQTPAAPLLDLGPYIALAWNDLGMHCFMADYEVFQVLPPFNTLWAQVIRRGDSPEVVTEGLTAKYHVPEETDPVPNTNFWDYAAAYGWDLEPGVGLKGKKVADEMDPAKDHFVAEGVPLVDVMDDGIWDPFPMFVLEIEDETGEKVASTTNVAPVSSEMSCEICHSGGPAKELNVTMANVLEAHDRNEGTDLLDQSQGGKPVLCANCHADPALGIMENHDAELSFSAAMHGFHADKMDKGRIPENECYACHPGPKTECQRGAMSVVGITCVDCHGDLAALGSTDRVPWMNLPTCESCHTNTLTPATAGHIDEPNMHLTSGGSALYRNRTGHAGIYCAACHGSPHALYASSSERDNAQSISLQGEAGPIKNCTVCHTTRPAEPFWHFAGQREN